jgi:hypothetical protein
LAASCQPPKRIHHRVGKHPFFIISQYFLKKSPLKPSGSGALFAGINLTTLSISSCEKETGRSSRLWVTMRSKRLKSIMGCIVCPILSRYSSQISEDLAWWSDISSPASFSRLVTVLIRYHSVATAWKKSVLSSPNLVHLTV